MTLKVSLDPLITEHIVVDDRVTLGDPLRESDLLLRAQLKTRWDGVQIGQVYYIGFKGGHDYPKRPNQDESLVLVKNGLSHLAKWLERPFGWPVFGSREESVSEFNN